MKAVRRERLGRSHAPANKNEEAAANHGEPNEQVDINATLFFQNKKLDNFSNEKTSATGSNESHDSPQHTLFRKTNNLGNKNSAGELI